MHSDLDFAAIREELRAMGVSLVAFCAKAGVDPSTFQRCEAGQFEPQRATERKIRTAIEALRAERGPAKPSVAAAVSPRLRQGVREAKEEFAHKPRSGQHPLFGAMKGTFTIEPGYDLTRPALDPEEWAEWEASLDRKADRYLRRIRGETEPE